MANERPNVTVVYQDAPQAKAGCGEIVLSVLVLIAGGIALFMFR